MLDGADNEQSLCITAFCMAGFYTVYVDWGGKFIIHWLILKVDRIELWKACVNKKFKFKC